MTGLTFLLAVALIFTAFFAVQAVTARRRLRRRAIERIPTYNTIETGRGIGIRLDPRFLRTGGAARTMARLSLRLMRPKDRDAVPLRLARAGLSHQMSTDAFLAAKALLAAVGLGLGALVGAAGGSAGRAIIFGLLAAAFGFLAPEIWVSWRLAGRLDGIEAELPGTLDMLAICVDAGLSIDAAINQVVEQGQGRLRDELAFTLAEMRMGERRSDALERLAKRVDVAEVGTFVSAVVRGERLGTPLTKILRSLSADLRLRRQLKAEERANKMAVKMAFPLGFCILPALIIIAVGPAVITALHTI